jgi:hypothetical protein
MSPLEMNLSDPGQYRDSADGPTLLFFCHSLSSVAEEPQVFRPGSGPV